MRIQGVPAVSSKLYIMREMRTVHISLVSYHIIEQLALGRNNAVDVYYLARCIMLTVIEYKCPERAVNFPDLAGVCRPL